MTSTPEPRQLRSDMDRRCIGAFGGHRYPVALVLDEPSADGSEVWKCPSCFIRYRTEAPDA